MCYTNKILNDFLLKLFFKGVFFVFVFRKCLLLLLLFIPVSSLISQNVYDEFLKKENRLGGLAELVLVEGGVMNMGSEDGYSIEQPVHSVELGSFWVMTTEVTQKLWKKVNRKNPSKIKGNLRPVDSVTWYDAVEFCNNLSELDNLEPCYTIYKKEKDKSNTNSHDKKKWVVVCNFNNNGYRLLTEAEWEYAARGGSFSEGFRYSGGDDPKEISWYKRTSRRLSHTVGDKQSNELGIYDMSGNISEWCWDRFSPVYYRKSPTINPRGAEKSSFRALRGGNWSLSSKYITVYSRSFQGADNQNALIGFRIGRSYIE